MNTYLMARVQGILLRPAETWMMVQTENTPAGNLFNQYVMKMSAIPAIAGFFGSVFYGEHVFRSLFWAGLYYILLLISTRMTVRIMAHIAKSFQVTYTEDSLLQLIAYSSTAFYVAGGFYAIPPFYWFSVVGLYGFYLFLLGADRLLLIPQEEKGTFIVLAILALAFMHIFPFALAGEISGTDVAFLKI
jgi:hypothetical protein